MGKVPGICVWMGVRDGLAGGSSGLGGVDCCGFVRPWGEARQGGGRTGGGTNALWIRRESGGFGLGCERVVGVERALSVGKWYEGGGGRREPGHIMLGVYSMSTPTARSTEAGLGHLTLRPGRVPSVSVRRPTRLGRWCVAGDRPQVLPTRAFILIPVGPEAFPAIAQPLWHCWNIRLAHLRSWCGPPICALHTVLFLAFRTRWGIKCGRSAVYRSPHLSPACPLRPGYCPVARPLATLVSSSSALTAPRATPLPLRQCLCFDLTLWCRRP